LVREALAAGLAAIVAAGRELDGCHADSMIQQSRIAPEASLHAPPRFSYTRDVSKRILSVTL